MVKQHRGDNLIQRQEGQRAVTFLEKIGVKECSAVVSGCVVCLRQQLGSAKPGVQEEMLRGLSGVDQYSNKGYLLSSLRQHWAVETAQEPGKTSVHKGQALGL